MVLLYLNEVKKEKIQLLNQYDASSKFIDYKNYIDLKLKNNFCLFLVLKEFCRIALDLFQKEINNKVYTSAARKHIRHRSLKKKTFSF